MYGYLDGGLSQLFKALEGLNKVNSSNELNLRLYIKWVGFGFRDGL